MPATKMTTNRLYFAQHGLAIDKAEDPERPLSDAGISQTQAVAKQFVLSGASISKIFHSGKLRALQTAEIFASALGITTLSASDHLSPNDDVSLIIQTLNINNVLYIGHLPHLEKLLAYLVTGDEGDNIIKFQNSAVVCLEINKDNYQLRWYLTPELLGC
jgi:phosphohistidine phosphatase